ncbi:hypothetical protein, partial [Paenibacillus larvae]|uniref:hypothetical protein n=1 Tax=Paenibacillus larvae TaxID=1464 RepID=UPI00227DE4D4|nr:hypothetical protein [Paenibacillus larvae]
MFAFQLLFHSERKFIVIDFSTIRKIAKSEIPKSIPIAELVFGRSYISSSQRIEKKYFPLAAVLSGHFLGTTSLFPEGKSPLPKSLPIFLTHTLLPIGVAYWRQA